MQTPHNLCGVLSNSKESGIGNSPHGYLLVLHSWEDKPGPSCARFCNLKKPLR